MIEILVSIAFLVFLIYAAAYAFSDRPIVYRDDRTGRYVIPRSKKAPFGRRHHDVD